MWNTGKLEPYNLYDDGFVFEPGWSIVVDGIGAVAPGLVSEETNNFRRKDKKIGNEQESIGSQVGNIHQMSFFPHPVGRLSV